MNFANTACNRLEKLVYYLCKFLKKETTLLNKNNVKPIVFSAICLLLFLTLLTSSFLFVGAHIKNALTAPDSPPSEDQFPSLAPQSSPLIEESESESEESAVFPSSEVILPESSAGNEVEPAPWILQEGEDGGDAYQDSLTFLGDSTTYGLLDRGLLSGGKDSKQVWFGVTGHTITFKFHDTIKITDTYDYGTPDLSSGLTIKQMAEKKKPEILVITLGVTGGVSYFSNNMTEELFTAIYAKLIDDILSSSPNTKIICNTIYPVCKVVNTETVDADITNPNIKIANGWIEKTVRSYYESGKNVYFLDSYSALVGEDGYLPANYTNGDGLHLSDSALLAVLQLLRTHRIPASR